MVFGLIALWALGITAVTFGPMIFCHGRLDPALARGRDVRQRSGAIQRIEARVVREAPAQYPPEAYSPPAHFDLLLMPSTISAGSAAPPARWKFAIARQFKVLADAADQVHARLMAEPVKLGLARRYFASYLPACCRSRRRLSPPAQGPAG